MAKLNVIIILEQFTVKLKLSSKNEEKFFKTINFKTIMASVKYYEINITNYIQQFKSLLNFCF